MLLKRTLLLLHPQFSKSFVIEAADFVFKNNTLTFDLAYYL